MSQNYYLSMGGGGEVWTVDYEGARGSSLTDGGVGHPQNQLVVGAAPGSDGTMLVATLGGGVVGWWKTNTTETEAWRGVAGTRTDGAIGDSWLF